ncbi:adenylosuccinate lyase [Pararhodobacter oceanensis]|uniref:Adenylosuccinate lyase n=1 Tax=Pararhodobacter oceanensis TaxID=2172121 RepID=A0A2T8HU54_9RHOB|nr:adenylosuccinate lyase [Pararhodobacter oceanensis]PVH28923.1 adenylosuccinate lyase [Pararhodobacter oceanensis]
MGTSVFDSILLKNSWSTEEMRNVFNDEARIQRWLDVEAALALVQADLGMIPAEAAKEIAAKSQFDQIDMDYVLHHLAITKHPLVPVVRGLEHACEGDAGEYVHFGVTTQDIIDTGLILQMKDATAILRRDLEEMAGYLLNLSVEHRNTPMMGRTLSLQAIPVTFGFKTAIWLSEIDRHLQRLDEMDARVFVGSIVGAVGTKASFGPKADAMEKAVNERLGLGTPNISWQPARDRMYEFGAVMGGINATLNKIGNQLLLLTHNEFDEIAEPFGEGQVGSSTMPHKRNPAVTENSVTVSNTLKSNINMMSDITKHEHERDGAIWKMEWKIIPEICLMLSVVTANLNFVLGGLEVKKTSMLANLDLLKGYALAERVMFALADKLGKQTAHEEVYHAAMKGIEGGITFKEALAANKAISGALTEAELDTLLDATTYVGDSPNIVDQLVSDVKAGGRIA